MDEIDGFRFRFVVDKLDATKVYMIDELEEFETITLPLGLSKCLAEILGEQHRYHSKYERELETLKNLIKVASQSKLDNDVLITCIKYGMDYRED